MRVYERQARIIENQDDVRGVSDIVTTTLAENRIKVEGWALLDWIKVCPEETTVREFSDHWSSLQENVYYPWENKSIEESHKVFEFPEYFQDCLNRNNWVARDPKDQVIYHKTSLERIQHSAYMLSYAGIIKGSYDGMFPGLDDSIQLTMFGEEVYQRVMSVHANTIDRFYGFQWVSKEELIEAFQENDDCHTGSGHTVINDVLAKAREPKMYRKESISVFGHAHPRVFFRIR